MSWFEHGGSRIYYEDAGQGDPVLFLPGWSESVDDFQALRDALTARLRVISADLPGSGKSLPQPRSYPPTYYEDDARSFLALIGHLGIAPAHVAGFSDGGEIALVMAIRNPGAVRSVAAWGAAGVIDVAPELIDAFEHLIDAPGEGLQGFADHLKSVYGEASARAMCQNVAVAWRAIAAAGGDISRAGAPSIVAPTLLITGEHDFFASPATVTALADAIPGSQFLEVPGAGHSLHEDHGDWLATTITTWFADH